MAKKLTLEKFMISLLLVFIISTVSSVGYGVYQIIENGGIKQTIINFGKDIKDIGREISKG